ELETLVNLNINSDSGQPSIDNNYFPNTVMSSYWATNSSAISNEQAWAIHFGIGTALILDRNDEVFVRLVSGGD
ncbi:MAG: hypothetical protein COB51_02800, partial [Moraxellaceae bacterium]